jgi:hypothetical protein
MKSGRRVWHPAMTINPISKTIRPRAPARRIPVSGHRQQIDLPSCGCHGSLKIAHKTSGGLHITRAGPWPPNEVPPQYIQQSIAFKGFKTTVRCRVPIVGIQTPNQITVFFDKQAKNKI